MLRLALIGRPDDPARYARVARRLRGARFSAVADLDARAARAAATELDAEAWAESLDALLARHAAMFDAAVVLCPGRFRFPLCQQAAAAGKHVLVAGPMASSAGAAAEVVAACARAGVRLMVGQEARFLPAVRVVKESLDAGKLGEPGLLRLHRWQPPDPHGRPLVAEIDLACWLFGREPDVVFAAGRRLVPERPGEHDYAQVHLGFGGGMALIDHARTLPPGDGYFSLSLIGATGAAYADDHHNVQLLFGRGHPTALATGPGDAALLAQLQEFVTAVARGREPSVTGADGVRALRVAEAAAESLAAGRAVSLAEG